MSTIFIIVVGVLCYELGWFWHKYWSNKYPTPPPHVHEWSMWQSGHSRYTSYETRHCTTCGKTQSHEIFNTGY